MRRSRGLRACLLIGLLLVGASTFNVSVAAAQQQDGFIPINPTKANKTIVLKGNRLTIQDVVDIARYGAKVRIAKSHQDYMNRAYNLIDAPFQRPPPAVEPDTTLREQIELAIARLEGMCSPEHAEELRSGID